MKRKGNILIVDDEEGIREILSEILVSQGYNTTLAKDGYEAIKKVKTTPIDIIFLDIMMPGMNGLETFLEVKNIRPQTVVVLMTAYATEAIIKEAIKEGVFDIIYKPFGVEEIIGVIEKALKECLPLGKGSNSSSTSPSLSPTTLPVSLRRRFPPLYQTVGNDKTTLTGWNALFVSQRFPKSVQESKES
ncbi:MAG: response regulator [bacterium]|nr:response regulator [bacterium]